MNRNWKFYLTWKVGSVAEAESKRREKRKKKKKAPKQSPLDSIQGKIKIKIKERQKAKAKRESATTNLCFSRELLEQAVSVQISDWFFIRYLHLFWPVFFFWYWMRESLCSVFCFLIVICVKRLLNLLIALMLLARWMIGLYGEGWAGMNVYFVC